MPRGVTLADLRTSLKNELGDADETNAQTDSRYNYLLANKQSDLANMYDWAFLKRQWDLAATSGSRYLTIPTVDIRGTAATPNFERPMKVDVFFNRYYNCLSFGIGPAEYNYKNSDLGEAQDPVMKWQVATNIVELVVPANEDQIEVWPIPVTDQTLRFVGQRQVYTLAEDDDVADIDSLLIVYGVAAEQLALRGQPNAPLVLRKFNERLLKVRAGMPSDETQVIFGYREPDRRNLRPIVLAGQSSSFSGTYPLGNGVEDGVVNFGRNLGYVPSVVTLSVSKPGGGFNIFATIVAGSASMTGFNFNLSAMTDSDQYVLNYMVTR